MQAFQFVAAQQPAELREVPVPAPGPGQVLVKIGGAGACHSDLHILEAPPKPGPAPAPYTLGHEKAGWVDRKSTRLNSSHSQISYAVFCLKKKKKQDITHTTT